MTKTVLTGKTLALGLVGVCLVAAVSIGATLAYLKSIKQVVNTFTIGTLTIDLKEPNYKEPEEETALLPGMDPISKDPTVTLNGEDAYVFMRLVIPDSFNEIIDYPQIGDKWSPLDGNPGVYIYLGNPGGEGDELYRTSAQELQPLFEELVVLDFDSSVADNFEGYGQKDITVQAAAIQFSGCSKDDAVNLLDWESWAFD